jgi:hypothetical protein
MPRPDYYALLAKTGQEDTDEKIKNIVGALIKCAVNYNEEVNYKYDFDLGPYEHWIRVAQEVNRSLFTHRILIDEEAIVCVKLNP